MPEDDIKRIDDVLRENPGGLKAGRIASATGLSRAEVNSRLYGNAIKYSRSEDNLWRLNDMAFEHNPVLQKLNNRENAKVFTAEEFKAIADWSLGESHAGSGAAVKYVTKTGNVIYTDSQSELDLLTFLEEYDLVREIGGQALMIKYCTCFRSNLKYYPDIIAQLKDGRIAIFEVKSDTAMSDHTNIEKYEALAAYCKQCGYMYMMVDPRNRYLTFEELERLPVIEGLAQLFGRWASTPDTERYPYKHFDKRAVAGWKEMYAKGMRDDEFNLQVHALIIRYGWFNTYTDGFMVYSKPVIVQSGRVVRWLE